MATVLLLNGHGLSFTLKPGASRLAPIRFVYVEKCSDKYLYQPDTCSQSLALSPGPSQILSRSSFLHGCEIKSGRGLGTRLLNPLLRNTVAIKHFNLLTDYKHPSPLCVHSQSPDAAVHSDLSETSEMFQQLQRKVMDLLDHFPNALAKLKQVLTSLVLPLGEGKVVPLVDPLAYENAQTVRELFRLMAPYWNPLSTDLLGLLLETSGCNQAASKVAEFVEARGSKGHLVLCIRQRPTLASGENDLKVADLKTVHNAPVLELQSLHLDVFARLPEHKVTSTRTTVRISVEVNKPLLCIADYEEITTALSGFFTVPKAALVYVGCSKAPLVLCWLVPRELVAYIRSIQIGLSGHRLLAESKVTRVAVGDQIYKSPTIKVRWA